MKRYKRLLKEENALSKLTDPDLAIQLIDYIKQNPYPQDHSGIHAFAESLGMEADELEIYAYAILSAFICGGNLNKSGKKEDDFDSQEIKKGIDVEREHTDYTNVNSVVKRICQYIQKRIALDHISESFPASYYDKLKIMEDEIKKGLS